MPGSQPVRDASACECSAPADETRTLAVPAAAPVDLVVSLRNLIPIGVVIAAGCEPCAAKTVARALQGGSAPRDVARALRVVAGVREAECFASAVGREALDRMERPLAAARRALGVREPC